MWLRAMVMNQINQFNREQFQTHKATSVITLKFETQIVWYEDVNTS